MLPCGVVLLALLAAVSCSKAPAESTHDLLTRLGFDPVAREVNHHRKRVAPESAKARHTNDVYSTDTDSHMFVVKLPPHHPYYAHSKPEKLEPVPESTASFRQNGKPSRVYHWNIPILERAKHKSKPKKHPSDSKIYHVKILPESKKFVKHPKVEERMEKPLKYHKNNVKFYKLNNTKEHVLSIKELAENGLEHLKKKHPNEYIKHHGDMDLSKHGQELQQNDAPSKRKHEKHHNEVFYIKKDAPLKKYHGKKEPSYYSPAIPKQNSFHKYFSGNGKPKSFYVIEKSEKPSRYHRLL